LIGFLNLHHKVTFEKKISPGCKPPSEKEKVRGIKLQLSQYSTSQPQFTDQEYILRTELVFRKGELSCPGHLGRVELVAVTKPEIVN
jgi:hypothetical protein